MEVIMMDERIVLSDDEKTKIKELVAQQHLLFEVENVKCLSITVKGEILIKYSLLKNGSHIIEYCRYIEKNKAGKFEFDEYPPLTHKYDDQYIEDTSSKNGTIQETEAKYKIAFSER